VIEIAKNTYQYRLGLSPLCEPIAEQSWEGLSQAGKLAAVVVCAGERPISFAYAQIYKRTAMLGTPGYDPEFAQLHVGEYAILNLIEVLIQQRDIKVLDYGLGYSQYKETLGTNFQMEGHIRVFSPSAKGLSIRALRTITGVGSNFLGVCIEKLGWRRIVKRWLRSHA
jgi:CelD/BcsL family acetyltransferase involved in cellulose biosynthesis